jgi:hypothetical protein
LRPWAVLSNRFARYQLLPWSDASLSEAERRTLAQHVYAQAYGDAAAGLELRLSDAGFGAPTLASGVDRERVAAIGALFGASGLKLVSVQPYLMSAFNGWRRQLGHGSQWFVLLEAGMMCAALLHQGRWHTLRMTPLTENWLEEMQLALHRAQLLHAAADQVSTVSAYMPEAGDATPAMPEWSVKRLQLRAVPGFSPASDGRYGMALAGAF